jgi:electron transfer flavoprotein beta subunit
MNVVVLLRVVDDPALSAGVSGVTVRLDDPSVVAIGHALLLRRLLPDVCVEGIGIGPPAWDPALKDALALGLDSVQRTWSDSLATGDIVATAKALATSLPAKPAFILAGSAATDHGSATLPAALAELLGWPLLSEVASFETRGKGLVALVRGGGGSRRVYTLPERAVLVVARARAPSIYPKVRAILVARKSAIPETQPAAVPFDESTARISLLDYGPPRPSTRHLLKPSASANPADRMRMLMSGGMAARGGETLDSSSNSGESLAKQLADIFVKEGFVR